jgi:hypothetical protein
MPQRYSQDVKWEWVGVFESPVRYAEADRGHMWRVQMCQAALAERYVAEGRFLAMDQQTFRLGADELPDPRMRNVVDQLTLQHDIEQLLEEQFG